MNKELFYTRKNPDFVSNFSLINEKKKLVNYSVNELKFIDYLFTKLQKMLRYEKSKSLNEINDEILIYDNKNKKWYFQLKNKKQETVRMKLNHSEVKKKLKFEHQNYMKEIENIIVSLQTKLIKIETKDSRRYINMFSNSNFTKDVENNVCDVFLDLNSNFLGKILRNNQFVVTNEENTDLIKSKYSYRIFQELERIIQQRGKILHKSFENLNKFFNTDLRLDYMTKVMLNVKKELEEKELLSFKMTREKSKNSKEWTWKISKIKRLTKNKNNRRIIKELHSKKV